MPQQTVSLLLQPDDVLFNNHGQHYESVHDWLGEQVQAQRARYKDLDYVQVVGWQLRGVEEGFVLLDCTVDTEDEVA